MKIIYAPPGENPRTFELGSIDDLEGGDCELIEEAGGNQWDTLGEWFDLLGRDGYRAHKVLIWALLRRDNPSLDLDDLGRFKMKDVSFEATDDEVEEGKDESGEAVSVPVDAPTSSASPTLDSAAA